MTSPVSDSKKDPKAVPPGNLNTVATPEGDNEFAPDQPLKPIDHGLQRSAAKDKTNP